MTPQERKVMELALEALEDWCWGFPDLIQEMDTQAITAIKEALSPPNGEAQPAVAEQHKQRSVSEHLEPVEDLQAKLKWATEKLEATINWEFVSAAKEEMLKAAWAEIKELREQIKEPEQEPVSWGDEQMVQFASMVLIQGKRADSIEMRLETFRNIMVERGTSHPPQRKPLTDEQTIILKNTTCPEIDWKARYFVEMNNGERNKWMLEWFIAFKVAIEEAHGIKE